VATPNNGLAEKLGYRIERTPEIERYHPDGRELRWYLYHPEKRKKFFERAEDVNAWLEYLEDRENALRATQGRIE